jgi:hypothetical protein
MTVETVASSNRRQESPRYCLTALTSSRPLICSDRVTVNCSPATVRRPPTLELFFEFLAFGLGAFEQGVGVAEFVGERFV